MCVRYLDRYRRDSDRRWRFACRVVSYDMRSQRAIPAPRPPVPESAEGPLEDHFFSHALFARRSGA